MINLENEENIKRLYELVDPDDNFNVYDFTISDFIQLLEDENYIIELCKGKNLVEIIKELKTFRIQTEKLIEILNSYECTQSDDEKKAALGINFPSFSESILTDCVDYFHLNSLEEAEKLKVCDWFLMKKRELAKNKYEWNFNKIMDKKYSK